MVNTRFAVYLSRALERQLPRLSREFPALLVVGPRQVGKTTLLRHACDRSRRYASLDDLSLRALANEDPALFLDRYPPPILIDEIQYAPVLLPYIKLAIDASRKTGQFWLTGSQHFRLMKGITETLAGRIAVLPLLGLSSRERHKAPTDIEPFLPIRSALRAREETASPATPGARFREIWLGSFPALVAGPT